MVSGDSLETLQVEGSGLMKAASYYYPYEEFHWTPKTISSGDQDQRVLTR